MIPHVTSGASGTESSVVLALESEDGTFTDAAHMTPDEARKVAIRLLEQAHTVEAFAGLSEWP